MVVLQIYQCIQWIGHTLWSMLCTLISCVLWLVTLPYTLLHIINNNMIWCYRELSRIFNHLGALAVDATSNLLYHVMLSPYYLGRLAYEMGAEIINCLIR